ncbi:SDR family NAD(P)-dependent oxidoreductase [Nocardia alni]|uniref:SDR family NAD(P)-dependent oxidoreductase n=1 Tax=Nocardia alni TaxID=2815723 RepID=UPI001C21CEC9|nr:SDR family NAD(P)-dependent oxidoreductase [Nocardia alni]
MKTILVTGATSGIGLAAAQQIAEEGDRLILVGRNADRLTAAAERVRSAGAGAVDTIECDVASQHSVRALAATVLDSYARIDVLANNAGGFFMGRKESADGIETTFATNHLGGFLLTELLLDRLIDSAPARVVFTSSVMHYGATMDFADLGYTHGYSAQKAYGRSKLANVMYARALSRRLAGTGVTANAFHPGTVATGIWDALPAIVRPVLALGKRMFMTSADEGGRRLTYLAIDPNLVAVTGCYFHNDRVRPPSELARDDTAGDRLCAISAELTGLPTPGA